MSSLTLTTQDTGIYKLATKSGSEYFLDLNAKTITRIVDVPADSKVPEYGEGDIDYGVYRVGQSRLQSDNEPVPLVNILRCTVGAAAVFLVVGFKEEIINIRQTSEVISIEKLES
jgi:hypothetical protein